MRNINLFSRGSSIVIIILFVHVQARVRAYKRNVNNNPLGVRRTPCKEVKPKKKRNYEGYLQKKFTPKIITNVLRNLSPAQTEWVKKAGFEHLLGFQMCSYPHRLGYKIVSVEQDNAV